MGIITDRAIRRMKAIMKQAQYNSAQNTDAQALEVADLYSDWGEYPEGTTLDAWLRLNYGGVLYKVLQAHQKQENWTPENAPSLFARVLIEDPSVVPDWEQPDSTNGYMIGDVVKHNGKTWESLVDNNVWEPGAVGTESVWKEKEEP